jgi:hypothetical protein
MKLWQPSRYEQIFEKHHHEERLGVCERELEKQNKKERGRKTGIQRWKKGVESKKVKKRENVRKSENK